MTLGIAGAATSPAVAAPLPSFATSCSADLDVGACERLDYIAIQQSQVDDQIREDEWIIGVLLIIAVAPIIMLTFGRNT